MLEKLWPVVHATFEQTGPLDDIAETPFSPPLLKRLPLDWSLPPLTSVSCRAAHKQSTASATASGIDFSGWENPVHRHVGTLVHHQLELIARHGIESWLLAERPQLHKRLTRALSCYGVAASDLESGVARVVTLIDAMLKSQRGRWILTDHPEAECELPLTGVVAGKLIHAVIDRTFVADGRRWIIDYKTSAPDDGESQDAFLHREGERYREQLSIYMELLALQGERGPLKAALYFPAIDGWYEY